MNPGSCPVVRWAKLGYLASPRLVRRALRVHLSLSSMRDGFPTALLYCESRQQIDSLLPLSPESIGPVVSIANADGSSQGPRTGSLCARLPETVRIEVCPQSSCRVASIPVEMVYIWRDTSEPLRIRLSPASPSHKLATRARCQARFG